MSSLIPERKYKLSFAEFLGVIDEKGHYNLYAAFKHATIDNV